MGGTFCGCRPRTVTATRPTAPRRPGRPAAGSQPLQRADGAPRAPGWVRQAGRRRRRDDAIGTRSRRRRPQLVQDDPASDLLTRPGLGPGWGVGEWTRVRCSVWALVRLAWGLGGGRRGPGRMPRQVLIPHESPSAEARAAGGRAWAAISRGKAPRYLHAGQNVSSVCCGSRPQSAAACTSAPGSFGCARRYGLPSTSLGSSPHPALAVVAGPGCGSKPALTAVSTEA